MPFKIDNPGLFLKDLYIGWGQSIAGDAIMPLLDKLFGKQEYPQQVRPATIPIKSLMQPSAAGGVALQFQQQQQQRPPALEPFTPSTTNREDVPQQLPLYPYTPQGAELQSPSTMPEPQQSQLQQQPSSFSSEKSVFAGGADASVFIKIDRYEEVLTELSTIKANVENFKAAVSAFENLRDLQAEIIGIMSGIAKDVERSHSKLDKILVEMQTVRERVKTAAYVEKPVEKPASVTDLEERIKRLRQEISNLDIRQ